MSLYIGDFKTAVFIFPFLALLITFPYMIFQYHKYGSVLVYRTLIIYSFIFYLMVIYFLVILPLPSFEEVRAMNIPRAQLIPFQAVADFIRSTPFRINEPSTYLKALFDSSFYVVVFNILMTAPFGIYLRYYFQCDMKKTILLTFLLSLFFELTQLTGDYFIYPRNYRLFDVDDLIQNTLGGYLGYRIGGPLTRLLPSREQIDKEAVEKGWHVSGIRRTCAALLDLFILLILEIFVGFAGVSTVELAFVAAAYYLILPLFLKGSTPGQWFLGLRIVDKNGKTNLARATLRRVIFMGCYLILPALILHCISFGGLSFSFFACLLIWLVYLCSSLIRYVLTPWKMGYGKLSGTRIESVGKIYHLK